MIEFTWRDSYKIGNIEVDAQHRHLFELANQIVSAKESSEITRLVMLFYQYLRQHFHAEENLMKLYQYPGYGMHVDAHNQMINKLNDISDTIHSHHYNQSDIQKFVGDWVLVHILEVDMLFGEFLKQTQSLSVN